MDTSFFVPPGRRSPEPGDLLRFVQNSLARACMDTRFRKLVGWRGFAPCGGHDGAATCRLTRRAGVYGISPDGFDAIEGVTTARFILFYFPHMDEPLFECLSPIAALTVAAADYRAKIRDFVAFPDLAAPFAIAGLTIGLGGDALLLSLEALERQRLISEMGIPAAGNSWVVHPGGIEQDVPAGPLARDFFDVLTAAATLCVGEPPRLFRRQDAEAGDLVRAAGGTVASIDAPDGGNVRTLTSYVWGRTAAIEPALLSLPEAGRVIEWEAGDPRPPPVETAASLCWRSHALETLIAEGGHAAAADRRPSLIVLCGYLGSGKTTLVNQIIEHHRNHDSFVAVIQNEIGATGVDSHLVEESDSVESLDEGCICCTLAGNLAKAAQRLIERYHPERIVLETTGLANPLNLLDELSGLSEIVRLDVIVTVVDAVHVTEALESSDLASDQIRGGDVLVLNKCDLVDRNELATVWERLRALNHHAPIIETNFAQVHPAMLLGDVEDDLWPQAATTGICRHRLAHADKDGHDGTAPEHHDHARHHDRGEVHHRHRDDGFSSIRVELPATLTCAELFELLDGCPVPAFRIKGIINLADADGPEVLQCVGNRREIAPLPSLYDGEPFLLFIGQNLDEAALRAHWEGVDYRARAGANSEAASCSCTV